MTDFADTAPSSPAAAPDLAPPTEPDTPQAGPSAPAAPRRIYHRKPKEKVQKTEGITSYTTAFVPGLYNVKNPAGDFLQKESNIEVRRQVILARRAKEKEEAEADKEKDEKGRVEGEGEATPNGVSEDVNGVEDAKEKDIKDPKEEEERRKEEQVSRHCIGVADMAAEPPEPHPYHPPWVA